MRRRMWDDVQASHFMKFWKKRKRPVKNFIARLYSARFYSRIFFVQRNILHFSFLKFRVPGFIFDTYKSHVLGKLSGTLSFAARDNPTFSIVIPVYNNILLTAKCLKSLSHARLIDKCEILIIDDSSTDETRNFLSGISGIKYLRNERNIGFIGSCNRGAESASGQYLLFLNNDTEVAEDWLAELSRTFENFSDAGLVGSRLVYPSGRLQEAGAIVWSDASAWNWRNKTNPNHPDASYLRDVDYVSGASIMVPRALFHALGGFDTRYQHSFYEDTDLAMSVRAAGYRVLYQPLSSVIHHEGASSGKKKGVGTKRFQDVNRAIFAEKWHDALARHHAPSVDPLRAADRQCRGHVLIVDGYIPTPDRDSGSADMLNMIRILLDLGYRVHFLPVADMTFSPRYTRDLQRLGVHCIYAPFYADAKDFIRHNRQSFDFVILCRKKYAGKVMDRVQAAFPSAKTLFYTVDLHFLRELRKYSISKNPKDRAKALKSFNTEKRLMQEVDATIVLSEKEQRLLHFIGFERLHILPLIRDYDDREVIGFGARSGISFIGGYRHLPNIDAVDFLVREIWPVLREQLHKHGLPALTLNIYGADMPARFSDYACDDIRIHGYVENLDDIFHTTRISIAPLRYGAGLKGKLATSFGYGVPVVGSKIAFEGMDTSTRSLCCTPSQYPMDYAEKIIALYYDEGLWGRISSDIHEYALRNYSYRSAKEKLSAILESIA